MVRESCEWHVKLTTIGALGPATSVRWIILSDDSPSFLVVNAFTLMRYSVKGSVKDTKGKKI